MTKYTADRYHDISCGHRVYGHESKCAHLHGHNYRIHFKCEADSSNDQLDGIGRVIDFSAIKKCLCEWLENQWDHKTLIWIHDPWFHHLQDLDPDGIVGVPFNPTAENMGSHLLEIAPTLLPKGIVLTQVIIEETRKCAATVTN